MTDYTELRRVAEAAQLLERDYGLTHPAATLEDCPATAHAFIHAASPDVVLALLDEVDRLREELLKYRGLTPYANGYADALEHGAQTPFTQEVIDAGIAFARGALEASNAERDEAREAVKRLAGMLDDIAYKPGLDDHDMSICARAALDDEVVKAILAR